MNKYEAPPVVFDGTDDWLPNTAKDLPIDTGKPRTFVFGPGPDGRYSLREIELSPPASDDHWHTFLFGEKRVDR